MNLVKRIEAFTKLGDLLKSNYGKQLIEEWAWKTHQKNNWFIPEYVVLSINSIAEYFLDKTKLEYWTSKYSIKNNPNKEIGVIMAGNIPLVGFHDALSVLISGNKLAAKLSSQDDYLLKMILDQLFIIEPELESKVSYPERMNNVEAIIATGSDNSSNYFEYYFKHIPNIIRRNRTSVAILNGNESSETLKKLGSDILQYYGLGCRNVSKLFVNEAFKPDSFYENIENWGEVMMNHKYKNNYDYNRSVLLVNQTPHFDNNFLILKESKDLVSPISVVFFEKYASKENLNEILSTQSDKIQCILSENGWYSGSLGIGEAQNPSLFDYADGVDTMAFLCDL
ncbi:MAG: acyl-CoA reductase [Bacteroidota bacterium]